MSLGCTTGKLAPEHAAPDSDGASLAASKWRGAIASEPPPSVEIAVWAAPEQAARKTVAIQRNRT
jgi:hypothetical protein